MNNLINSFYFKFMLNNFAFATLNLWLSISNIMQIFKVGNAEALPIQPAKVEKQTNKDIVRSFLLNVQIF